jgi:hypothetical protein
MKKTIFMLLAVMMLLIILTIPALATQPDNSVEGRWCYGNLQEGDHKIAGGNEFYDLNDSGAWFGNFNGYSDDQGRIIQHASGYLLFKSHVTFASVEVGGKSGGLEMQINGWLPVGGEYSDYEGLWVITKATGELKGLNGQGTWGGVEFFNNECLTTYGDTYFVSVPYWGSIHFENE